MGEIKYKSIVELKEIKAYKSLSNDMVVVVKIVSHDINLLDLGKFPADTAFECELTPSKEYGI